MLPAADAGRPQCLAQDPQPSGRWADFVNPLIGTDSEYKLSNGNTYPAIATPWGMNFWTPQTGKMGDGWGYTYDGYKIRGFKQTHQPSPWINDYAAFALLPRTGKVKIGQDERASWFSHKTEVSRPHYYKVYLSDYDVTTEIAPTDRAAHFRFTFPQSEQSHHWTWCVFHDPAGLAKEFGGVGKMRRRLDEVFEAAPTFDYSYYGHQIHEITEMAVAGMGQYAHGNQPIQHAPYLYNWTDQPWKAQQRVRQIMDTMYTPLPDGLCGDEDNGQTSAWYVFSALGFYPVAPGTGEYAIGSPLFKQAKVRMGSGKLLDIKAPANSEENVYVQSVRRNGKSHAKTSFTYDDLQQGGRLQFNLDKAPNQSWGQQAQDKPYSLSREVGQ